MYSAGCEKVYTFVGDSACWCRGILHVCKRHTYIMLRFNVPRNLPPTRVTLKNVREIVFPSHISCSSRGVGCLCSPLLLTGFIYSRAPPARFALFMHADAVRRRLDSPVCFGGILALCCRCMLAPRTTASDNNNVCIFRPCLTAGQQTRNCWPTTVTSTAHNDRRRRAHLNHLHSSRAHNCGMQL